MSSFHSGAQPISSNKIPSLSWVAFDAAIKEYEDDSATEDDGEDGE